jgi:hypothetical protein
MENPTSTVITGEGRFTHMLSSRVLHALKVFWSRRRPGTLAVLAALAFSAAFAFSTKASWAASTTPDSEVALPESLFEAQEAMAQPSETVQHQPSLVGLWKVTFYSGGHVLFEGFTEGHSDGTEILNTNSSPGAPHGTGGVCLGVYKKIGPTTFKAKHLVWIFDDSGQLAATVVIPQKIMVNKSGNTYSGSFSILRYDLDGKLIGRVDGTLTARRITLD